MVWKDRAKQIIQSGVMLPVYNFAGGLSEFWALVFGVVCIVLAFKGKLDANFAMAVTAITGILAAHDAADDYHWRNKKENKDSDEK